MEKKAIRVLSLDGGGTKALLTIEMLKVLERATGRKVYELFDVIAGTSTGGILALAIQASHRPHVGHWSMLGGTHFAP